MQWRYAIFGLIVLLWRLALPWHCFGQAAGIETFYVLGREDHVYSMFQTIAATNSYSLSSDQMASVIALAAIVDDQVVYYDHWEDGYESDIFNPVQSSTEVIHLSRGDTRIFASREGATSGSINDYVPANPRGTSLRYDGNDKIVSTGGPINVVRALWPGDGRWIGGAWELYAVRTLEENYRYRIPVGRDAYSGSGTFSEFQNVYLQVQATRDNTLVVIDNGSDEISVSLDAGETYSSQGYIDSVQDSSIELQIYTGTTIYASKAVQAGIITAGSGTFQTRFYQILPDILFGSDYIVPVPSRYSTAGGNRVELYLFNPNNSPVTISYWDSATTAGGSFTIPAQSAKAFSESSAANHYVPVNSAVRLSASDIIWGVGSGGADGTPYDWGFSLIPQRISDDSTVSSWAPGNYTTTANLNPVYLSPVQDGTVFNIDTDGDGTYDLGPYTADVLDPVIVFDNDYDLSGAFIDANGPFTAAYGCDPLQGNAADNLDWGFTILPLTASYMDPVIDIEKTASPASLPLTGGSVDFTLTVRTFTHQPVNDVDIVDVLPAGWTYTSGTARITYPNGDSFAVEPQILATGLLWDISQTMSASEELTVTFSASVVSSAPTTATRTFDDFTDGGDGNYYNDGSGSWVGNWTEVNDDGSSTSGDVQVSSSLGSPYSSPTHLYMDNSDNMIWRRVNLSNYNSPELVFYRRLNSYESGDEFKLDISIDGGLTWRGGIMSFGDGDDDDTWHQEVLDLSSFAGESDVRIRFRTGNSNSDWDYAYVDDVLIRDRIGTVEVNQGKVKGVLAENTFRATDRAVIYRNPISLVKTVDSTSATVGDKIVYSIALTNTSSAINLSNVWVTDPIPADVSLLPGTVGPSSLTTSYDGASNSLTWSVGALAASSSVTLTFSVTAGNIPDGEIINNRAKAGADAVFPVFSNTVETLVVTPHLRCRKSGPGNAYVGDQIEYSIDVSNTGGVAATNTTVSDSIPSGSYFVIGSDDPSAQFSNDGGTTWTYTPSGTAGTIDTNVTDLLWNLGSMPATGVVSSVSFSVEISSTGGLGDRIYNVAEVSSDETRSISSNTVYTYVTDVRLTKQADRSIARPGQLIDFSLRWWNEGASAVSTVVVTDPLSEYVSYISSSIETSPGVSVRFSTDGGLTYSSSDGSTAAGQLTTVTHIEFQVASLPASASSTAAATFTVRIDNPLTGNSVIENQASLVFGDTTVSAITEDFESNSYTGGSGWTGGWIESEGPPHRSNRGSVRVRNTDPYEGSYHLWMNRTRNVYRVADITSLTHPMLTFWRRVVAFNNGTETAHLDFSTDGGSTWNTDILVWDSSISGDPYAQESVDLTPYQTDTFAIRFRTGTANANGDYFYVDDIRIENNILPEIYSNLVRIPTVDLEISKVADKTAVTTGDTVTFTITYSNNGSATATDTVIYDNLPDGLTYVAGSASGTGSSTSSRVVTWSIGDLVADSGPLTVSFQATVDSDVATGTSLRNLCNTGNAVDLLMYNSAYYDVVVIGDGATVTPDGQAWGNQGDYVYYAHRIFNGSGTARTVEVTVSHTNWSNTSSPITIYTDTDGDGEYDPGIDTALTDTNGDGTVNTSLLASNGGEARIIVGFPIDSSAADGDVHTSVIRAALTSGTQYDTANEITHVLSATAVTLKSFTATGSGGLVRVRWITAAELKTIGFFVLRSDSPDGPRQAVNESMVIAHGWNGGASYEIVDKNAEQGRLYWYWLMETDSFARQHCYGPAPVDWDGDGMPDVWELDHGLDVTIDDSMLDPDDDGLSNMEEFGRQSDPRMFDANENAHSGWTLEEKGYSPAAGIRLISVSNTDAVVECRTPDFEVLTSDRGARVIVPSYVHGWSSETGLPLVPRKAAFIEALRGKAISSVETLVVEESPPTAIEAPLLPVPESIPVEDAVPPYVAMRYERCGDTWNIDAPYPPEAVALTGKDILSFAPLAYNPVAGTLTLRRRIVARIHFTDTGTEQLAGAVSALSVADWPGYPPDDRLFFRVKVDKTGMQSISHADLAAKGWPAAPVQAATIALFDRNGEVAIHLPSGSSTFGPGDRLVFFARASTDLYDDGAYFFITPDIGRNGARFIPENNPPSGSFPLEISTHRYTARYESDYLHVPIAPGNDGECRHFTFWFTAASGAVTPLEDVLTLDSPVISSSEQATCTCRVNSDQTGEGLDPDHVFNFEWEGSEVGVGSFEGTGFSTVSTSFSQDHLLDGDNDFRVTLEYQPGMRFDWDRAWLDYLDFTYTRQLSPIDGRLDFELPAGQCTARITGLTTDNAIIFHHGPENGIPAVLQNVTISGSGPYTAIFSVDVPVSAREFSIVENQAWLNAAVQDRVEPCGLHNSDAQTDFIVVIPSADYRAAIDPLVQYRTDQGLSVRVLASQQVYDHFSGGRRDPWAFRDMLVYARDYWAGDAPRYFLLAGAASWDPRNLEGFLTDAQNRSLLPSPLIMSYWVGEAPADALLGFLNGDDGRPSVAVGRIPAVSPTELAAVANKLVQYETREDSVPFEEYGLFVAGVGTGGETQEFEQALEGGIRFLPDGFMVARIHQSDYASAAGAQADILYALNDSGALVLSYQGHGFWDYWSNPEILDNSSVLSLHNNDRLPILIGMTCLDGFFLQPNLNDCLAASLLKSPAGGVAAAYCSAGTATTGSKQLLNDALFEALFVNGRRRIGQAVLEALNSFLANSSDAEDVVKTHALLGDPTLLVRLPFPDAPLNLKARDQGSLRVLVSWDSGPENDIVCYRVLRGTDPGGPYMEVAGSPVGNTVNSLLDTVPSEGSYYYVVKAEDDEGFISPPSMATSLSLAVSNENGGGGGGCTTSASGTSASAFSWLLPFLLIPLAMALGRAGKAGRIN